MSKRKIIILIIILIAIVAIVWGLSYFTKTTTTSPTGKVQETNFFSQIFPTIKNIIAPKPAVTPPANISGFETPEPEYALPSSLIKVSSVPIAGYGIFMKERFQEVPMITPPPLASSEHLPFAGEEANSNPPAKGSSGGVKPTPPPTELVPAVRYVDKIIGNIYQTFADKIDERKVSEVVIPNVREVYFGNNGESVVLRYLKTDNETIETFLGILPKESPGADTIVSSAINGNFLPGNISTLSISPDSSKMFYLFNSGNSAVGIVSSASGDKKSQIFDSPFTEWLSEWPNAQMITLTTKPSANVPGYMYAVDPNKKDFNKVIGNINGLTTLTSPDGQLILYSSNSLFLNTYNTKTGESVAVGLRTLPEKCVWNKTSDVVYCAVPKYISPGNYPDSWYMGEVSFSDEIWRINIQNGSTILISDISSISGAEGIDGINLTLDDAENYLFFMNKKDSYLWKLDLK